MPRSTCKIGKDGLGEGLEESMHVFGALFETHGDVVSVRDFREADADGLTEMSVRNRLSIEGTYSM